MKKGHHSNFTGVGQGERIGREFHEQLYAPKLDNQIKWTKFQKDKKYSNWQDKKKRKSEWQIDA